MRGASQIGRVPAIGDNALHIQIALFVGFHACLPKLMKLMI